jgi:hypothetical protein
MAMHNANKLKIGLFGRTARRDAPSRWCRSAGPGVGRTTSSLRAWQDAPASTFSSDRRWKGYGGDTDYQGATLETITLGDRPACADQARHRFGTVHAPLFNPIIAAKEMVTADHIGEGRFGLNIVVGWNEGEFAMFGVKQREHEAR